MQLKRDTEYALRIQFCFESGNAQEEAPSQSLTINELCVGTGIPRIGLVRICARLEEAGFIRSETGETGEVCYRHTDSLKNATLLDIIRVTEPGSQLFGVFDRSSLFYKAREHQLQAYQDRFEQFLSQLTMGSILPPKEE